MVRSISETTVPTLEVPLDALSFIVLKARAFDAQTGVSNPNEGSDPIDDSAVEVLEGRPEDPTAAELSAAIRRLSMDQQAALVALAWIGRGDFDAEEWEDAKQLARERHTGPTWRYLLGTPLLGDYLEDGAAALGVDLASEESASLYHGREGF